MRLINGKSGYEYLSFSSTLGGRLDPSIPMSTDQRIRGRRLQAIREAHFAREPLCIHCFAQGRTRLATELVMGDENWQGLCAPCADEAAKADAGELARRQTQDG